MKNSFEIQLEPLPTLSGDDRLNRFARLVPQIQRAAEAGSLNRLNPRAVASPNVLADVLWATAATQMFSSIRPDDLMRDDWLPEASAGGPAVALWLLRKLANVQPQTLLHPILESERAELPKVPVWTFNNQPLPNPFLEEIDDRESQLFLKANHPELAALLEKEATGGPTYLEHFAGMEREKQLKAARAFSGENPFLADDSISQPTGLSIERAKAISELTRTNPILAEQLKREAELRGVNPYSTRGHDTTAVMRVLKFDKRLAAMLKAAAQWEGNQLAREAQEAEARAAEAVRKAGEAAHATARQRLAR
ncbi:MAG: hypothetical protein IH623_26710 [Verrucomicrobia bacterium]|nr:hypothetical protein [Verrucomicrobiota bacterium]